MSPDKLPFIGIRPEVLLTESGPDWLNPNREKLEKTELILRPRVDQNLPFDPERKVVIFDFDDVIANTKGVKENLKVKMINHLTCHGLDVDPESLDLVLKTAYDFCKRSRVGGGNELYRHDLHRIVLPWAIDSYAKREDPLVKLKDRRKPIKETEFFSKNEEIMAILDEAFRNVKVNENVVNTIYQLSESAQIVILSAGDFGFQERKITEVVSGYHLPIGEIWLTESAKGEALQRISQRYGYLRGRVTVVDDKQRELDSIRGKMNTLTQNGAEINLVLADQGFIDGSVETIMGRLSS